MITLNPFLSFSLLFFSIFTHLLLFLSSLSSVVFSSLPPSLVFPFISHLFLSLPPSSLPPSLPSSLSSSLQTRASIEKYLLEKSRIISQAPGEGNYHVFYYLLAGADRELRRDLKLLPLNQYHYLTQVVMEI